MWKLKYGTNGSIYKTKRFTDIVSRVFIAKGEWGRKRDGMGGWVGRFKLLYTGWINNKVLTYSTGN